MSVIESSDANFTKILLVICAKDTAFQFRKAHSFQNYVEQKNIIMQRMFPGQRTAGLYGETEKKRK